MNNTTSGSSVSENNGPDFTQTEQYVIDAFWLLGILASCTCALIQIALLVLIPKCRKFDEKILIQMTVARLIYTTIEFIITKDIMGPIRIWKNIVFALYIQSDAAMVCWMFLFTKNLYDKLVLVFIMEKRNFIVYISIAIWLLSLPLGVIFTWLLKIDEESRSDLLDIFYKVYGSLKFAVLLINMLFFCRIFHVVYLRSATMNRNVRNILKTCVVSFIMVCTYSLQVLVTDVLAFFGPNDIRLSKVLCVINSYQIIAITIIFVIVVKSKIEGEIMRTVKINCKELLVEISCFK